MPVKVSQPASKPATATAPTAALDAATLKQIQKLSLPLAKRASAMKLHGEELEKSTFQLYADFRKVIRDNFADNPKAARQLVVNVLATVYDIPTTAINLDGRDRAVWVYPDEYVNAKGKTVPHPKAGEEADYDELDEKDQALVIHPVVEKASTLYQRASKILKVATPSDERAMALVDEALSDDGICICTEPQLIELARGSSREIQPKDSHGGTRTQKTWDAKTLTAEIEKAARKAWNGEDILPNFKGSMDLEEIGECFNAALANMEAESSKAERAQAKAASKATKGNGKTKPEPEEEE